LRWGHLSQRSEILGLFGLGIGYVDDAHLLAATMLTTVARLWTRDKRLAPIAVQLGVASDNGQES